MSEQIKDEGLTCAYLLGKADGYSQAEKDYYKQTEKDRQSSYDCGYEQGRTDQKKKDNEFFNFESAWELEKQKIKADTIEDVIKTLAKSEDTILSDRQYYALLNLKGEEE